MAIYVNGRLLREALLRNGYSDREFCRMTGIGQVVLRTMLFQNETSPGLAIADVINCARAAGVSLDDLLTEPVAEPSEEHEDDAVLLCRLLIASKRKHPDRRIAATLGWELPHLRAVMDDLDARLEPVGMHVTKGTAGVALTHRGKGIHKIAAELDKRRDSHESMHHGAARVLYKIMNGTLSTREISNDTQVQIGSLSNRGAVTFGTSKEGRFGLRRPEVRPARRGQPGGHSLNPWRRTRHMPTMQRP